MSESGKTKRVEEFMKRGYTEEQRDAMLKAEEEAKEPFLKFLAKMEELKDHVRNIGREFDDIVEEIPYKDDHNNHLTDKITLNRIAQTVTDTNTIYNLETAVREIAHQRGVNARMKVKDAIWRDEVGFPEDKEVKV